MTIKKCAVFVLLGAVLLNGAACGGGETPAAGRVIHVTNVLSYDESAGANGSIVFNYNLSDPLYWREIVPPPNWDNCDTIDSNNCQAGDPDLFYNASEGAYYIVFRYKTVNDEDSRMKNIVLLRSEDLENWTEVWNVSKYDIAGGDMKAIEKAAIAEHDGRYYLHMTWDSGGGDWRNSYVQDKTLAGLGAKLLDLSYWHPTEFPGLKWGENYPGKFNNILFLDGSWYYLKKIDTTKDYPPYSLMVSENATGPWNNLSDPAKLYCENFYCASVPAGGPVRAFTILRDANGKYIYWSSYSIHQGATSWWWWAVSDDLIDWTFVERAGPLEVKGQWRFWDFEIERTTGYEIAVAQMSIGDTKKDSIVLWTFPTEPVTP